MKNSEVLEFAQCLNGLRSDLTGRLFTHAVVLNQQKIEPFVKALEAARKPSDKMQEYLDQFEKLKIKYAIKDATGQPLVKTQKDPLSGRDLTFYDIPSSEDPHSEFTQERNDLYNIYKKFIDENTKMIEEWVEKLLSKASEFKPTMIDLSDIPDLVNTQEMRNLIHMINE